MACLTNRLACEEIPNAIRDRSGIRRIGSSEKLESVMRNVGASAIDELVPGWDVCVGGCAASENGLKHSRFQGNLGCAVACKLELLCLRVLTEDCVGRSSGVVVIAKVPEDRRRDSVRFCSSDG